MEHKSTPEQYKVIIERNDFLEKYFKRFFPNNTIRIVGDINKPNVIFDFDYALACYCQNFNLHFLDKNDFGETLFSVKLNNSYVYDIAKINSWLQNSQHKKLFKVALKISSDQSEQPTLFVSGWNYLDKENKTGKYPVFSEFEPKVYFSEEKAKEIAKELKQSNYQVEIIH
jgi:hypothetical protein